MDQLQDPIVETSSGSIRGRRSVQDGLLRFFGIPYAEPPIGARRFRRTEPIKPWPGTLDAGHFGPASAQLFDQLVGSYEDYGGDLDSKSFWVGSEDSLTLNVWTPGIEIRRPVVVWIHGGGNWLEASRLPAYHGHKLALKGDVVFVSFNYRLGVFGFLDIEPLGGKDYAGCHSNGLLDQITALKWVKANISAFGGDPDLITVMGQSAGSMDISFLLAGGHLTGLAKRVIMMSGVARVGCGGPFSVYSLGNRQKTFLDDLKIDSIEQLLSLETGDILDKVQNISNKSDILLDMDTVFYPQCTSELLNHDPTLALSSGMAATIDLLIGHTGYELGLWLLSDSRLDGHSSQWAASVAPGMPPIKMDKFSNFYDEACSSDDPGVRGMHLLNDALFAAPSHAFADAHVTAGGNCWFYRFDWERDSRSRALHFADQIFLFGTLDSPISHAVIGQPTGIEEEKSRLALSSQISSAFLSFIKFGNPNFQGLADWPQYDCSRRSTMSFNRESDTKEDPIGDRRRLWMEEVIGVGSDAVLCS